MSRRSSMVVLAAAVGGLLLAGCAKHRAVRRADQVAKTGDWETALTQYRLAAAEHPGDGKLAERVQRAEREVAQLYLQRAADANVKGDLGLAGELWRKALELTPDPAVQDRVRAEVQANASSLEYFGDVSADFYAWEDALGAYGALLLVSPNSVEILEKYREAKREFAGDLTVASDELTRRNLKGAALVTSLRALQHDPMQPGAFDRVTALRKELAGRTKVAIQRVDVEEADEAKGGRSSPDTAGGKRNAEGWRKTFSLALVPRLTTKIADYPPYGPTKDPKAIAASFVLVIEALDRTEKTVIGEETLPNTIPASKEPIPNPAIAEQEKVVAALNRDLKDLQAELNRTKPGRQAKGRPAPRKKLPQTEEQRRKAGLELARKVDLKRQEIASALETLTALPATVPPPPPPPTFTLPWKDVTRTVTAKVRFELREKDFAQPIARTVERTLTRTDRTHDGNEKQGLFPDPLDLPTFEAMFQELASQFDEGAEVIAKARDRRVERVLAEARNKKALGDDEAALDGFVESLFLLGADSLPEDAAVEVAKSAENEKLNEILGAK